MMMFIAIAMMGIQPEYNEYDDYNEMPVVVGSHQYEKYHVEAMMLITSGKSRMPKESWENLLKNKPEIRIAMQEQALKMELLDPRETKYILAKKEDFYTDANILMNRHLELCDAPLLDQQWRFPDRSITQDYVQFNRTFRKNVEQRMQLETDRKEQFMEVIQETDYLYQVYDAMRDARCDFYYVTVRRTAMKKLVQLLGQEDYDNMIYPPCAPFWRFAQE